MYVCMYVCMGSTHREQGLSAQGFVAHNQVRMPRGVHECLRNAHDLTRSHHTMKVFSMK